MPRPNYAYTLIQGPHILEHIIHEAGLLGFVVAKRLPSDFTNTTKGDIYWSISAQTKLDDSLRGRSRDRAELNENDCIVGSYSNLRKLCESMKNPENGEFYRISKSLISSKPEAHHIAEWQDLGFLPRPAPVTAFGKTSRLSGNTSYDHLEPCILLSDRTHKGLKSEFARSLRNFSDYKVLRNIGDGAADKDSNSAKRIDRATTAGFSHHQIRNLLLQLYKDVYSDPTLAHETMRAIALSVLRNF